jgi:hypothetical protein
MDVGTGTSLIATGEQTSERRNEDERANKGQLRAW